MALPRIKEATSESSEVGAGDARGIRRKELLAVHVGDELPSKMLSATRGEKRGTGGTGRRGVLGAYSSPFIQAGPASRVVLAPLPPPSPGDADE